MKKELSPAAIIGALVVVAIIGIVVGLLVFKPQIGPGPVVEAPAFSPPGSWSASTPVGSPGAPGGQSGAPMGAPSNPDGTK